jgi:hypothetical protein
MTQPEMVDHLVRRAVEETPLPIPTEVLAALHGEPVVTVPGGGGSLMGTALPGPGTAASVNPSLTSGGR